MGEATSNFEKFVKQFIEMRAVDHRYASFDYCFNYFQRQQCYSDDMEKSCMMLGFYLASWGMYRGSSFILQKSASVFIPLIEYFESLDRSIRSIDVDAYGNDGIEKILEVYHKTSEVLIPSNHKAITLSTKILLGVFGFVPAYDSYFCKTFRSLYSGTCAFRSINKKSLSCIFDFYQENQKAIDQLSKNTFTADFCTGAKTDIKYPKAKIIDMYGFTAGQQFNDK
ncbi:MAG: hypothetical protein PHT77_01375 [Bacteroidales bacterium]|nr:hypothetical protein [Bacteroidales bacterium]